MLLDISSDIFNSKGIVLQITSSLFLYFHIFNARMVKDKQGWIFSSTYVHSKMLFTFLSSFKYLNHTFYHIIHKNKMEGPKLSLMSIQKFFVIYMCWKPIQWKWWMNFGKIKRFLRIKSTFRDRDRKFIHLKRNNGYPK